MKAIAAEYEIWHAALPVAMRDRINSKAPKYVFGRTPNSAIAAQHIELAGVIDDFAAGSTWKDLPVVHGDDVPADAIVISTILHRYPVSLNRLATLKNRPPVINYCDFVRAGVAPLDKITESHQVFFGREVECHDLWNALDAPSQKIFYDIMLFRLTGDPAFMAGYPMREDQQYFDVPLNLPENPIFADGGAYKGETTLAFCTRFPGYGGSHIFEPVPDSMDAAQQALIGLRNMKFHPCALGNAPGEIAFDTTAGTSAHATQHGNAKIRISRLDDEVDGRVDFIKFDLEGFEVMALDGAACTIRDHHPALAICVYHSTADFLDVPAKVFSIRADYDLALRHYTQGWNETVMYFIPRVSA